MCLREASHSCMMIRAPSALTRAASGDCSQHTHVCTRYMRTHVPSIAAYYAVKIRACTLAYVLGPSTCRCLQGLGACDRQRAQANARLVTAACMWLPRARPPEALCCERAACVFRGRAAQCVPAPSCPFKPLCPFWSQFSCKLIMCLAFNAQGFDDFLL